MEKDVVNRYQSASQMLRHIYRIKKDPTTIFQKQTPAPRTPTAEVAIRRTTVHPEEHENAPQKVVPQKISPRTPQSHKAARPARGRRTPEYVPFSVVIVICIAFLALAIIGFVILFYSLANAKVTLPEAQAFLSFAEQAPSTLREEACRFIGYPYL